MLSIAGGRFGLQHEAVALIDLDTIGIQVGGARRQRIAFGDSCLAVHINGQRIPIPDGGQVEPLARRQIAVMNP